MSHPHDSSCPYEVELYVGEELLVAQYGDVIPFVPALTDIIRTDVSGSFYEPPAAGTTLGLSASDFTNSGTIANVPEPTSGLLMLVGLAGLALRRRRA